MTVDEPQRAVLVEHWLTIDGALDNTSAVETVGGDSALAEHAREIRQRGWDANARHPEHDRGSGGWAPDGATIRLPLSRVDLRFIREQLQREEESSRILLAQDDLDAQSQREQVDSLRGLQDAAIVVDALLAQSPE